MDIEATVTPESDEELVAAARLLFAVLGTGAPEERPTGDGAARRDGAFAFYATLVLTLPGAMVALVQLREMLSSGRERAALKDRIEPVFAAARQKAPEGGSLILRLHGHTFDLGETTPDELLDALADYEDSRRRPGA